MKKILLFVVAIFCATLLFTSCSKEPKTCTITLHVQTPDGKPVPERVVFYTADKAAYEKAIDTKAEKEDLWVPSETIVVTDAQGTAKILLELDKSKNVYFLVRHPRVNQYNSISIFVFKGQDQEADFVVGE